MGTIGFYIFYCINWVITLLPLRILFIFSDFLFLLLYYFPSYRRKIVAENLKNSFPEKTDEERRKIGKKFYRHFADLFIETLKLIHLSRKELAKRITITNPDLLEKLYNDGYDLVGVTSHFNNWEWMSCLPLFTKYKLVGIYKPIQNKLFNRFMNSLRKRNNTELTPMSQVARSILENKKVHIRALYGFIADQSPAKPLIQYRTKFLNQDTPVYLGIEKIAAKYDMPVLFFNVQKVKRGYYSITIELLFEKPGGLPEYQVTDAHVQRLEALIREKPEYWLWTHRRWKY